MGRDVRGDQKRRKSPVEIYWISGSPFAWRVLLTAEVKGIPYEGKLLEASKGELKTSEFLAINSLGRVPALRDGNFTNPLRAWAFSTASTQVPRFSDARTRRRAARA